MYGIFLILTQIHESAALFSAAPNPAPTTAGQPNISSVSPTLLPRLLRKILHLALSLHSFRCYNFHGLIRCRSSEARCPDSRSFFPPLSFP
jgi:hypothetical protein